MTSETEMSDTDRDSDTDSLILVASAYANISLEAKKVHNFSGLTRRRHTYRFYVHHHNAQDYYKTTIKGLTWVILIESIPDLSSWSEKGHFVQLETLYERLYVSDM